MIKPGYKTSEFWFTMVSFVFSGLYLLGLIGDINQKDDLIRDVSHGVESIILIGGQLALLYKYINSRKEIKTLWWSTASIEEREEVTKKYGRTKNVDNQRTSKPRSRKTNKTNKNISK